MIRRSLLLFLPLLIGDVPWQPARAQLADVVQPNPAGAFLSTRVAGHRGPYPQRQWLVIARGSLGLDCHNRNGNVLARLAYGSVVDTALPAGTLEGVETLAGLPWLWLRVQPQDLRQDLRPGESRQRPLICRVRSHADLVAPINPDTLTAEPPLSDH